VAKRAQEAWFAAKHATLDLPTHHTPVQKSSDVPSLLMWPTELLQHAKQAPFSQQQQDSMFGLAQCMPGLDDALSPRQCTASQTIYNSQRSQLNVDVQPSQHEFPNPCKTGSRTCLTPSLHMHRISLAPPPPHTHTHSKPGPCSQSPQMLDKACLPARPPARLPSRLPARLITCLAGPPALSAPPQVLPALCSKPGPH
jgi:hypothetical protein